MSIVFIASDSSDVAGVSVNTATSGDFDANYTDRAFGPQIPSNNFADQQGMGFSVGTITGDLWVHFRMKANAVYGPPSAAAFGVFMEFFSATGASVAAIEVRGATAGNGWRAAAYGDTTVTGTAFAGPYSATSTFDIQLTVNTSNIILNVYMNGVLVSSATAANSTGLKGKPKFVQEQNTNTFNKSSGTTFPIAHSELVATDSESTIGWRVAALRPTGNGANTAWLGDFNDIASIGDGAAISSATVADKESWTVNAYAGPASPSSIRGLVTKYVGSKGTSGPQNIEPLVRLSSVDYMKTPVTPDNTNPIYADWTANPATSAPWATADLTSIQIGVRAAT